MRDCNTTIIHHHTAIAGNRPSINLHCKGLSWLHQEQICFIAVAFGQGKQKIIIFKVRLIDFFFFLTYFAIN